MRQQLRLRVLAPVAVLALLGAGVGAFASSGGDNPGGDENLVVTHPPKKKAPATLVAPRKWAKQANAICRKLSAQTERLDPATVVGLEPALAKALTLSTKAEEDLRALGLPRGRQANAKRLLATVKEGNALVADLLAALRRGDGPRFRKADKELVALDKRSDRLARSLGAGVCAAETEAAPRWLEATPEETAKAMLRYPAKALSLALLFDRAVVVVFYRPRGGVDAAAVLEARSAALETGTGFLPVNVARNATVAALARKYEVLSSPAVLVFTKGPRVRAKFNGYADEDTIAQAVANALR